jgi:hypothetical protein
MDFDSKDICEVSDYAGADEFNKFLEETGTGLQLTPERYGHLGQLSIKAEAGRFAKWIAANSADVKVTIKDADQKIALHSNEIWLPLAFLASDTSLSIYLNIVSSYLYDKMKGALKGDSIRVNLRAVYKDEKTEKVKEFTYDGDDKTLQKIIKRIDLNDFLDE